MVQPSRPFQNLAVILVVTVLAAILGLSGTAANAQTAGSPSDDRFCSGAISSADFCVNLSLGGPRTFPFDGNGDGVADVCSLPYTRREAVARQSGYDSLAKLYFNQFTTQLELACDGIVQSKADFGDNPADLASHICKPSESLPTGGGDGGGGALRPGGGPPAKPAPQAPRAPSLTHGDQTLTAVWSPPSNSGSEITDFDLRYCIHSTGCDAATEWQSLTGSNDPRISTTATVSGLTNGLRYLVQVRAANDSGRGPWFTSATGTPVGKPSAPDTVTVASGNNRLIVSWNTPTDNVATVSGFKLRYCNTNDANKDCYSDYDDWTTKNVSGASTRSTTITSLTNGYYYDAEIATHSSNGGDSDWYCAGSGTLGAPNASSAPSLSAGDGQITVTWTAPAKNHSDIQNYEIAYCHNTDGDCTSGIWNSDCHWDTSTLSLTLTSLDNGKAYKVRVRASNDQGAGAWSSTATATATPTSS